MGVFSSSGSAAKEAIRLWVGDDVTPRRTAASRLSAEQLRLAKEILDDPVGYENKMRRLMEIVQKVTQWLDEAKQRGDPEELIAAQTAWCDAAEEYYGRLELEIDLYRTLREGRRLPGSGLTY